MIEEYGVVRKLNDEGATVEITMPGECERCEAHDACRRAGGLLDTPARSGLSVGQSVKLRVKGVSVLGATAVVYGIPLAAMFLGLVSGYLGFSSHGEDVAVALAEIGRAHV